MTTSTPSNIELLQRHSLPSLILCQLESMILLGKLMPGSQLTEIPLATQFGVSRGPVREAFRALAVKGLVRIEKNRGVFVRIITPTKADDLYEVRIPVEKLIVTRLARTPERLAPARLDQLLDKSERLARKGDFAGCHECNMAFHDRLAELAGNAALLDVYRRLVSELSLYRHQAHAQITDASSLRASVADHRGILAAIAAGDGALAARRVGTHIEASRKRTQRYLASTTDPDPQKPSSRS
jgi:DNA-binding GntR family transcriptional regulator